MSYTKDDIPFLEDCLAKQKDAERGYRERDFPRLADDYVHSIARLEADIAALKNNSQISLCGG